jgi:hypothetical protein
MDFAANPRFGGASLADLSPAKLRLGEFAGADQVGTGMLAIVRAGD